jgi:hypothetical protein
MKFKKLREIETDEEFILLSHSMMYNLQSKKILIFREATWAEENGIPINNDYPYGQPEILELEFLHPKEDNNTTKTIIILDELKTTEIKRMIKITETK